MELYSIKRNKLNNVRLNPFKKEREIQDLVEENTETLFDVDFERVNKLWNYLSLFLFFIHIVFFYSIFSS